MCVDSIVNNLGQIVDDENGGNLSRRHDNAGHCVRIIEDPIFKRTHYCVRSFHCERVPIVRIRHRKCYDVIELSLCPRDHCNNQYTTINVGKLQDLKILKHSL